MRETIFADPKNKILAGTFPILAALTLGVLSEDYLGWRGGFDLRLTRDLPSRFDVAHLKDRHTDDQKRDAQRRQNA